MWHLGGKILWGTISCLKMHLSPLAPRNTKQCLWTWPRFYRVVTTRAAPLVKCPPGGAGAQQTFDWELLTETFMSEQSQPNASDEVIKLLYGCSFLHFTAIMLRLTLSPPPPPTQYFLTPSSRFGWHTMNRTDKNPCLVEHSREEENNNHKDTKYVRG